MDPFHEPALIFGGRSSRDACVTLWQNAGLAGARPSTTPVSGLRSVAARPRWLPMNRRVVDGGRSSRDACVTLWKNAPLGLQGPYPASDEQKIEAREVGL
jgi:hypothetical protein